MALQEACTGCSASSGSLREWPFKKPGGVGDSPDPLLAPFPRAKAGPFQRAKSAPLPEGKGSPIPEDALGVLVQLLLELIRRDRQDPRDALHKNLTERTGNIVV